MKLKISLHIDLPILNSMRNTKNTVKGGLACVVCEIWAKNANPQKRSKNRKRRQGLVRHFFQKSMKIKIWNYMHQSTLNSMRNTKNTVKGGLACVVCEKIGRASYREKRSKN